MFSFALIRPRIADWRGWLPLAALPLFMFAALLALGGDRGYFYHDHEFFTLKRLAAAENLSPEHNFRLAIRVWRDESGGFQYDFHGRFPVGGYALVKLAIAPFGNDLAAKLLAARVLMILMFCGAALFAALAVARITGSRRVALAATLLAFSGLYTVRFADRVLTDGVMDLFGAALVFHGMAVFVQEGRFRQLLLKTCAALLLGWHVYGLLLPFIVLGLGGEAIALSRSALASGERAKAARSAAIALARSRYAVLAAVSILFGSALLAFNIANEYTAYGGETEIARLPMSNSIMRRFGLTDDYAKRPDLEWSDFIAWRQLYRVGVVSTPYSLARAVGYDFPTVEDDDQPLAPVLIGTAAAVAALGTLGALALARRRSGILPATAVLFGFCWSIPMRYQTFDPSHVHESFPYISLALTLFALALLGVRGLMGERGGGRLALAFGAAAALAFALSVFHAGRIERDADAAERDKSEMARFSDMREMTRGKSVAFFPRYEYSWEYFRDAYYLSGSHWDADADSCDPRRADFVISRYRNESLNPRAPDDGMAVESMRETGILNRRAPDNRLVFLYEGLSPLDMCRAARRALEATEPSARSVFDVYLQDGALSYLKATCEPRDYEASFFAYVHPADPNDLPAERRRVGYHSTWWNWGKWRDWDNAFARFGVAFDGACLATLRLPDYPISAVRTGQAAPDGETVWEVSINPPPSAETLAFYEKAYQSIASSGEPAARSGFDLYLDGDTLSYLKAPCGEGDARGRFFLSVHPVDAADLPADRREIGHESLNFTFAPPAGVVFNGKCMATRPLPDYDIERIETGQWIPGGERLWDARIAISD